MQDIKNSIKYSFKSRSNYLLGFVVFAVSMFLYYWAIIQTVSFDFFVNHNPLFIVIAQITLSIINALLISLSFIFFREIFKTKQSEGGVNLLQAIAALFFSVASTGCYVCGSVLLPAIGIAASITSLPFGGLEIKLLTVFLLLYSVRNLARQLTGYCEIKNYKTYKLTSGSVSFKVNFGFIESFKPLAITSAFVILILALPSLMPTDFQIFDVNSDLAFCSEIKN
jgi:hypothetical protein